MTQIIFIHILKCGGTSLRYMFLEQFGYDKIAPVPVGVASGHWGYPYVRNVNPLEYQEIVTPDMVAQYDVVMSHYDWRISERLPERQIVTMFRNPVDQLYSLYRFMRWNRDLRTMHPEMQSMAFRDWITSNEAKPLLNTQTRYLSAHGGESLNAALANLRDERLAFGLVERFEESVMLFNRTFNWSMRVRHDNAAPEGVQLDNETLELAESLQNDDMVLYKAACELFEERIREYSV